MLAMLFESCQVNFLSTIQGYADGLKAVPCPELFSQASGLLIACIVSQTSLLCSYRTSASMRRCGGDCAPQLVRCRLGQLPCTKLPPAQRKMLVIWMRNVLIRMRAGQALRWTVTQWMGCPQLQQISPNPWKNYEIDCGRVQSGEDYGGREQAAVACSHACFAKIKCSAISLKDLRVQAAAPLHLCVDMSVSSPSGKLPYTWYVTVLS